MESGAPHCVSVVYAPPFANVSPTEGPSRASTRRTPTSQCASRPAFPRPIKPMNKCIAVVHVWSCPLSLWSLESPLPLPHDIGQAVRRCCRPAVQRTADGGLTRPHTPARTQAPALQARHSSPLPAHNPHTVPFPDANDCCYAVTSNAVSLLGALSVDGLGGKPCRTRTCGHVVRCGCCRTCQHAPAGTRWCLATMPCQCLACGVSWGMEQRE